jgi:hypothetical protein
MLLRTGGSYFSVHPLPGTRTLDRVLMVDPLAPIVRKLALLRTSLAKAFSPAMRSIPAKSSYPTAFRKKPAFERRNCCRSTASSALSTFSSRGAAKVTRLAFWKSTARTRGSSILRMPISLPAFAGLLGIAIERQQADAEVQKALEHQAMLTREVSYRVKLGVGGRATPRPVARSPRKFKTHSRTPLLASPRSHRFTITFGAAHGSGLSILPTSRASFAGSCRKRSPTR